MKKIVLFTLAVLVGIALHVQEKKDHNGFMKGDKFVYGIVGYNSRSHSDKSKERSFKVSARRCYFLNDFVAVGGRLGYGYYSSKNNVGTKVSDNNTITAEVFGRYYLLPGSKF